MKPAFWFAWRELLSRKAALVAGVGMVCVAVTLCAATELVSRAREAAVAAEIDHIGPALRLIPATKTANDLARFQLGSDLFGADRVHGIRRRLAPWVRAVEGRLLLGVPHEGGTLPVIGIDPGKVISPFEALAGLGNEDAALGADLARRLGQKVGNELLVQGRAFQVAAILPETASAEDLALYLPLGRLQNLFGLSDVVNEIRVFPAAGAPVERIVSYVQSQHPEINVINTYRGDTAEHGMGRSLHRHRRALYVITAMVIALCILVWSYLNGGERRLEMATVVAVGGTGMTVLSMLVIRAAIVAFLGALAGYMAGASIALGQDFESAFGVVFSLGLLSVVLGGAIIVSVFGAMFASIFWAFREHVTALQE